MISVAQYYENWKKEYYKKEKDIWEHVINELINILEKNGDDYDFCKRHNICRSGVTRHPYISIQTSIGVCDIMNMDSYYDMEDLLYLSLKLDGNGGISKSIKFQGCGKKDSETRLVTLIEKFWENVSKLNTIEKSSAIEKQYDSILDKIKNTIKGDKNV